MKVLGISVDLTSVLSGVGGGAVVFGLLVYAFKSSFKGLIEKNVRKDVASFEQSLDEKTERLKQDLHKEMLHAQIATEQRHKIYAEMHKLLQMATGLTQNLNEDEISVGRDYSREEPSAIDDMLIELECPREEKERILDVFSQDRDKGNKEINKFLRIHKVRTASMANQEAVNFFRLNELHMSEEVAQLLEDALASLQKISRHYEFGLALRDKPKSKAIEQREIKLPDVITAIRELMRKEMKAG